MLAGLSGRKRDDSFSATQTLQWLSGCPTMAHCAGQAWRKLTVVFDIVWRFETEGAGVLQTSIWHAHLNIQAACSTCGHVIYSLLFFWWVRGASLVLWRCFNDPCSDITRNPALLVHQSIMAVGHIFDLSVTAGGEGESTVQQLTLSLKAQTGPCNMHDTHIQALN